MRMLGLGGEKRTGLGPDDYSDFTCASSSRNASHVFLSITPSSVLSGISISAALQKANCSGENVLTVTARVCDHDVPRPELCEQLLDEFELRVVLHGQRRL